MSTFLSVMITMSMSNMNFLGEGRNRNHQGLACAILKLWEKSLVAKIAVKRGIQNTNNKLMAEELKVSPRCCIHKFLGM